jgi:hypothetical protein
MVATSYAQSGKDDLTMKAGLMLGLLAAVPVAALAQDSRSDLFSQQPGRYQIVFNPSIRADLFLIDTATGRVWQRTSFPSLNGEPDAWLMMNRLDDAKDRAAFISMFGRKSDAVPVKPALSVAPAAPLKLQ